MFLSAGYSTDRISSEISGLRCTYSFIFMPLVNLPIYSCRTQRALLWLTYCSVLGNMGPEEWELAYSCLIDVNKKCRTSFPFFPHIQMQSLTHCTDNLTQGVRINSKESRNLWQNEISPHLCKLPLREYIIGTLNIAKDATENEFRTKTASFCLSPLWF